MQNFVNFCQKNQANINTVFISDLHLPIDKPVTDNLLGQAFLGLLDKLLLLPNLQNLYILGDWFDAWLGDDVAQTFDFQQNFAKMLQKLTQLSQKNCQILVMIGNRDFLLGQGFCDMFGAKLIKEPYCINLKQPNTQRKVRLEHGDKLCTDDKNYQRFAKIIQNPLSKQLLLSLSQAKRQQIAHKLRQKSRSDTAKKPVSIMDVNADAVNKVLASVDILLHGHTHRPKLHLDAFGKKKRLVLGDWRVIDKHVEAVIAVMQRVTVQNCQPNDQIDLIQFTY
ncbi:UDP-2,3-diacylglucosamine hydrolase [Moraxella macacae 0408225]|uniref:UDP-2,3-diacylglucosamine hydrolase n=1 Tax=Moraxella macacae 0408225 TaxID=1230338 RepID=L2F5B3_9GAMM|nr:UDP-2,3-diacylglucosamine diphosphatase [Moraxella macacae]ELA08244.1 UDP-2,3-diacylglucosamine hydrolase [Moraxella macacae 0408225]